MTLLLILSTAALALGGLLVILAGLADGATQMTEWYRTNHVCGWCRVHLRGNPFSTRVSHGICRRCAARMKANVDAEKQK